MQALAMESLAFFHEAQRHFRAVIERHAQRELSLDTLLASAWHTFDSNVSHQTASLPEPDCYKGCATCCTLRVTATAPEVFMLARFIRAITPGLLLKGIDLVEQVAQAHRVTHGVNEQKRIAMRSRCPFIARGVCVIYQVRPLACRGLASYDRKACAQAASGTLEQIPYSEPHMRMRSLIQNALQSALRDCNLAWGNYELNHALMLALSDERLESRWWAGEDALRHARVSEVSEEEMAQTFDHLKQMAAS